MEVRIEESVSGRAWGRKGYHQNAANEIFKNYFSCHPIYLFIYLKSRFLLPGMLSNVLACICLQPDDYTFKDTFYSWLFYSQESLNNINFTRVAILCGSAWYVWCLKHYLEWKRQLCASTQLAKVIISSWDNPELWGLYIKKINTVYGLHSLIHFSGCQCYSLS